jgi:hypothetical protein
MLWAVWVPIQAAASPKPSLRDALMTQAVAARSLLAAGSIAKNTGNGHQVELAPYGAGQVTAAETVEAWTFLVEQFDLSASALGGSPTDALVEARMELDLRPIGNVTGNWMYLSK